MHAVFIRFFSATNVIGLQDDGLGECPLQQCENLCRISKKLVGSYALHRLALPVAVQKPGDTFDRAGEFVNTWQEDDAQMIRFVPVKAPAMNQQNLLRFQQVQYQLFIVVQVEFFDVEFWKQVQRALRLEAGDTGYVAEHAMREVALLKQPATWCDKCVDALEAAKRRLYGVLSGHVAAQAQTREHIEAFDEIAGVVLGA